MVVKEHKTFCFDGEEAIVSYEFDDFGNPIFRTIISLGVTTEYTYKYEYKYDDNGDVQKCIVTTYFEESGNVCSIETMERIN